MDDPFGLLRELTSVHAVSGYEDEMIDFMHAHMAPFADEIHVDHMGSVVAVRHGRDSSAPRMMVFAHMDEVGFMVKQRDPAGYLRLIGVHGNHKTLPGHVVQVRTFEGNLVPAIVGVKSQHLATAAEANSTGELQEFYVYPVASEHVQDIEIGNTVSFSPTFQTLSADLVCSKALDNRAGCYVLIEALRRLRDEDLGITVAFVGTVQEELSCDGSLAPAQAFGAAMAVAVDGTVSYDTPDTEGQGDVRCGRGPVITRMLRTPGLNGWTPHPRIAAFLEQVATTAGIPFQRDAVAGLMSDARPLQLGGIPSAVIGIPMRGKHSPAEIISVTDLQHTVDLVVALVRSVGALKLDRGRG